jgi:NADH:ubiquinone oxidoreductase subunit E
MFERMLTPDVVDQMMKRGLYSADEATKRAALIKREEDRARRGSIVALNYLYAQKKDGYVTAELYESIKQEYEESR